MSFPHMLQVFLSWDIQMNLGILKRNQQFGQISTITQYTLWVFTCSNKNPQQKVNCPWACNWYYRYSVKNHSSFPIINTSLLAHHFWPSWFHVTWLFFFQHPRLCLGKRVDIHTLNFEVITTWFEFRKKFYFRPKSRTKYRKKLIFNNDGST